MEDRMQHTINNEGLHRLVRHELNRLHPATQKEAYDKMIGRMGAYDRQGYVIEEGVRAYFEKGPEAA